MADNDLTPQPTRNNRFRDPHTDKRIHEHLSNKEDQISEDDIRSVKVDIAPGTNGTEPLTLPDDITADEKLRNQAVKDNDDAEIVTPYNILKP